MVPTSNLSIHYMLLSIHYMLRKCIFIVDSKSTICSVYSGTFLDVYMGNAFTIIVSLALFCLYQL